MLTVRRDVVVRLALEPVDFRKSIDGLAIAVGRALGRHGLPLLTPSDLVDQGPPRARTE